MAHRMTKQEREWQIESDARTLAEAQVISADAKRVHAARIKAAVLAKEQEATARGLRSVAARKTAKRAGGKARTRKR